jgi:hypothetical protein
LVRRFASDDRLETVEEKELDVPLYWVQPPRRLSAEAGMHRWVWDLHYTPPDVPSRGLPISAIYQDTPRGPHGPFVAPGKYMVRLTVDGRSATQPLIVRRDPRVQTPPAQLAQQHRLSMQVYEGIQQSAAAIRTIHALQEQIVVLKKRTQGDAAKPLEDLETRLAALAPAGGSGFGRGRPAAGGTPNLEQARGALSGLLDLLQSTDQGPTTQAVSAVSAQRESLNRLLRQWSDLKQQTISVFNEYLLKLDLSRPPE